MKKDWKKIASIIVLISFIIPIVYIIYKIVISPTVQITNLEGERIKTDYILMLSQCVLGIIAIIMPSFIVKKIQIKIPTNIYIFYLIFLYLAIFLGEVKNFYYKVPHWDTMLHAFSGMMLGALGFSFVFILNKEKYFHVKLTPIFISLFAFCFALTIGVFWEIFEFLSDGILQTNMQKFAKETGEQLIGRIALVDTMKDLIVDIIGAFIMSFIGWFSLKYRKNWIYKILIKSKKELKNS